MSDKFWLVVGTIAITTAMMYVGGCGHAPVAPSYRTLTDFSSLKLSEASLITSARLPKAPPGFDDADVQAVAGTVAEMAVRGTYNRDVWHPESQDEAIRLTLLGLDPDTRSWMRASARESLDGRPWANVVGTVLAKDVQVTATPQMQRATWDVSRTNDHGPQLDVRLQTVTFYPVRRSGVASVIAVTRTIGLSSPDPVNRGYSFFTLAVDAPGAEPCDFILRSVIRPEPDVKRYRAAMKALIAKPTAGFVEPAGDGGSAIAKACTQKEG